MTENRRAAKVINEMIVRMTKDGTLNSADEISALNRAVYVLKYPDCYSCDYFVPDTIYNDETSDEYDISYCDRKNMEQGDEWIPVNERLPEDDIYVLCTLSDGNTMVLKHTMTWGEKYIWVDGRMGTGTFSVIAWMPLPEPYKGD